MRAWVASSSVVAALLLVSGGCVRPALRTPPDTGARLDIAQLWEEPGDLARRDLLFGPGGKARAPQTGATYTFRKIDTSGYSPGYDVVAPDGREWSVKLGPEAQSEVAASRILWAIGYHQPAVYYVPAWTLAGQQRGPQGPARFRLEDPAWNVIDEWSWYENEFVGTRPFKGLVVANLVLNNWDWKTSNNKVIEYRERGESGRLYIVRDLGASFGRTTFPAWLNLPFVRMWKQGTRNNIQDFESQNLIKRVSGERIEFDYRGANAALVDALTRADVLWACRLMARLSDRQWHDAFRAAGYSPDERERFVRKIKSKIAEGLALAP